MTRNKKDDDFSLKTSLERLRTITAWFDSQESVDVEEGLAKVKEGVALIKSTRARLRDLENEFTEIKAELDADDHVPDPVYEGADS